MTEAPRRRRGRSFDISLAAADASAIYVAFAETDAVATGRLAVAATTNGGGSWTARTVVPNYLLGSSFTNPSIVLTPSRVVTVAWEVWSDADYDSGNVKVWRTSDHGATWSPPATVRGQGNPAMTLDASNTVHLVVFDEVLADPTRNDMNLLYLKER